MQEGQELALTKNTKILLNLLEIRIFDLSQALQVAGHKLSINQVKETLQKQYNIFGQIQKIFDELKMNKLYDLMKQVSQNYISISSILIDSKTSNPKDTKKSNSSDVQKENQNNCQVDRKTQKRQSQSKASPRSSSKRRSAIMKVQQETVTQKQIRQTIQKLKNKQIALKNKLGGIHLYNQNYYRGTQSLQKKYEALESRKKKHYDQKELIKQLIYKEISDKADVEKLYENDEISKFIKEGKIKHDLYNHIEYEKDLESISSFLKQSQDDALKFLTDSKKIKDEDSEQDMIINYHELIQILAEKKKAEYQVVQNKIKEIVENFKIKMDILEDHIVKRDERIRELQLKLRRKQGKEYGMQTLGFRSKFNTGQNSQDSIQQIEQQHKAVVQLLKKNLEVNQKQLLNLETDVRSRDQKIKKKETEIFGLNTDVERLKKLLKEEKQKNNLSGKSKYEAENSAMRNSIDNPIDLNLDKADLESIYGNEIAQEESFPRGKRRKQKHSIFGNHSNSILTQSRLSKPRENSILSSGLGQSPARRVNSFAVSNNDHHYRTQVGLKKYEDVKTDENQYLQTSRQELFIGEGTYKKFTDEKNSTAQNGFRDLRKEETVTTLKEIEVSADRALQNIQTKETLRRQANNKEMTKQVTKQDPTKQFKSDPIKQPQQERNREVKQSIKFRQVESKVQKKTPVLNVDKTTNQRKEPLQPLLNVNSLLNKNTETLYEVLFTSLQTNDLQLTIEQQINDLKAVVGKYNQRQLHSRLRRIMSLLNINENSDCEQIEEKEISQQEDSLTNSTHRLDVKSHWYPQTKDKNKEEEDFEGQNVLSPELNRQDPNNNKFFRKRQIRTDIQQWEKEKSLDVQKMKQKKYLKKAIPSTNFLKKLHQQIRISGKGFDLSKKDFINMCKNINVQQGLRSSQNTSRTVSQDQNNGPVNQKHTPFKKYKNKENLITEYTQKDEIAINNVSSKTYKKLMVEGVAFDRNSNGETDRKQKQKQKQRTLVISHQRNQSKSFKNLAKQEPLLKSHKFSISKEISHQIMQSSAIKVWAEQQKIAENKASNIQIAETKGEKLKKIKQFYKILKSQGARIESVHKLEEILEFNKLTLQDMIKITNLLKSERPEDISKLFSVRCEHSNHASSNQVGNSTVIQPCCSHAKKYSAFMQKLSLNEQSIRKMRKDLLALHVLNIDGNSSQKDFHKKKQLSKQKSSKFLDLTNSSENKMRTLEKIGQAESFHVYSKKISQKGNQEKETTKKPTVSVYIEGKDRNVTQALEIMDRRSYRNVSQVASFLPQLSSKAVSQLIRN